MKITFLMPALNLTGGARVVSMYAQLLSVRGHQVTVISPNKKVPTFKEKVKSAIKWKGYSFKTNFDTTFFDKHDYDLKILNEHRPIKNDDLSEADLVIATFWNTAEWMSAFSKSKGKKVYFIQHYEVHPWLPLERVESTLRAPFHQIVVSQWIADVLASKYGKKDVVVVGNGVDLQQFSAPIRKRNKHITVGVMYADELSFKGCDTSINSVIKARESIPNIKLVAFAMRPPVESLPLPDNSTFYLKPEQENIKAIYSQCDAWLFGSRSEGFGLPLLEAMACRTPVIATKAGAAPELLESGVGYLIEIDNVDAMANAILTINNMSSEEWSTLSNKAYTTAVAHSWDVKVVEFENELNRIYHE